MASRGRFAFLAGFKRVSRLYLKSKIGMVGLTIIVFFISIAALAPVLGPNDPLSTTVGNKFDVPEWSRVVPQYGNLPVDSLPVSFQVGSQTEIDSFAWNGQNLTKSLSPLHPSGTNYAGSVLVNASIDESLAPGPSDRNLPGGQAFFSMSRSFGFTLPPPSSFEASVVFVPLKFSNVSTIYVQMKITDPQGRNFTMSSTHLPTLAQEVTFPSYQKGVWKNVSISAPSLLLSGIADYGGNIPPSNLIFNQTGTYQFTVEIQGVAVEGATQPAISVGIAHIGLHLDGSAYGLLGTDQFGRDVWSQFVWGSQISLLIGILSAVGSVGMGTVIGITGGYLGGRSDEVIGRMTDFVLVLPFLPLLIIISTLLVGNASLSGAIYFYVILIFVVLSWPVITKIVRAQVLSVKERPFVEASRALGSGTGHILRRHILPNVMGLVYSQVAQNVAGFILLEAALDFLAISIHGVKTITWGLMLTYSLPYAVHHPDLSFVWWWFFPPGIAIASLSLSFVLVGYSLDTIFNPRLRAR